LRAQAKGVAQGSSPGRLVAAARFKRNVTIRRFEFVVAGVDVGSGVQKNCRHGPVPVFGAGVQKRLAQPIRSVRIESACQQPAR
jgi:hypothetical protein